MQYDYGDNFIGENIDIGLNGSNMGFNPDFGPNYNPYDDHLYGYSERSVKALANERLRRQNGLNYDNVGQKYPGPPPPEDYSYFMNRWGNQGFKSGMTNDQARDYAILISSNVHYFVLLFVLLFVVIITIVNTVILLSLRNR